MKILIFAAHPDDETLGCGGTILKYRRQKDEVYLCIVTEATKSLKLSKQEGLVKKREAVEASRQLGIKKTYFLELPSVYLDTIPKFQLINKFKSIIEEVKPDFIYTHHEGDLNQDHKVVSEATLVASYPFNKNLKKIYFYEVPSSTTFNLRSNSFVPNTFVDIADFLEKKIAILKIYQSEIKKFPHPRSPKGVQIYAAFRGMISNCQAAEAFTLYRDIIR